MPAQKGRYYFEFLRAALVRSTIDKRTAAYASAITNGWMTRNEIRERENLNPLDMLDEPLQPLNMVAAGTVIEPAAPSAPSGTPGVDA